MNKIFKVIWSNTKNCYVVASEFAKSWSNKTWRGGGVHSSAAAILTVLALTGTMAVSMDYPVYAANQDIPKDSESNVVYGQDNTAIKSQADPAIGSKRADANAENVIIGTRNAAGVFKHDNGYTTQPDGTITYENLPTKVISSYNAVTGQWENITVYDLTAGQHMDDAYNINTAGADDNPRYSYYVSGATVVGVDSVAEGNHSTAMGNNARVLNSTTSFYVKGDGSLTTEQNEARWFTDENGNKTTTPTWHYNEYGQADYITNYYMVSRYTTSDGSVAVGYNVTSDGINAVAVGQNSYAHGDSVAIGNTSSADWGGVAMGAYNAAHYNSVAIGTENDAKSSYSLAAGHNNNVDYGGVGVGNDNTTTGAHAVAIGNANEANGDQAIANGYGNHVSSYSIGLGNNTTADNKGIAIGTATYAAKGGLAIGNSAQVTADNGNGVALGDDSVADIAKGQNGYDPLTGTASKLTNTTWKSTDDAASVGSSSITRQITHVAAGTNDTDVVNVAQLKKAKVEVKGGSNIDIKTDTTSGHTIYTISANDFTGNMKYGGDSGTVITQALNSQVNVKGGVTDKTKLADGNIGVVSDGTNTLNVKLAKDLKNLDSVTTGNTVINTNGMTVTGGPTITNTKVDVNNQKITSVKAGDVTSTSTDAVNGSQLKSYTDAAKTVVKPGANVTVTSETDKDDKHVTYTVAADDMRVKSGTVTYSTTDNTGSVTLTNGDGTQTTINGLKDTYTKSGILNGTTETFTRNDNTTYDVDLSGLTDSVTNKGLKFGANSGAAVTNKLGSLVNVIGEGTKEDNQYSGTNIKTKVSQTEDGTTSLEVMMDKNITGDSVTVGGKDGKDGVNGTIGVKGADGKDGVNAYATNGKDGTEGHIGLTGLAGKDGKDAKADITVKEGHVGVDGTDGHNGKDGMDRVEYKDHNDVTHEVATLDDGLKFKGDTATVIAKKLNETMDIKGGADSTKLTEGNIGVVAENGALNVKLAKDLKDLNSVTTGNTVINTNGMTVTGGPTITNTKVDVNNQKITSVKAGDVTSTSTDAVNGSQLKSYTDAAKTVVKQGANVTVTSETDKDDKHVTYTVAADNMRVKSGTVTYSTTDNTGSVTLTNGDGTQATINGLKDTYTKSGVLNGTTETFTRNDNTTYDVDLSGLTSSVSDKGLKFGANSGAAVTNKLGSLVNVIGEGTKEDNQYSGTNIKTKVSQTEDGTTSLEVMMDKNITGDSVTVGGKDGKDGVNGTIGVKGADGKDGVNAYATNGKDGTEGHIGLTGLAGKDGKDAKADITVTEGKVGVDGTDGHNGKDGMDRVEYKDHNDVTHEVATLDDGLKFKGDTETVIAKKLNETMDIKGGADSTKLTNGNIGVVAENGALNVKLAKDLKDLNSVTTGNTVINTNGMTVTGGPTITNTKVDVNNQKITSVKAGDVTSTSTDAVNGSQLKSYTDAAKTVVKQGANVTVTSETDKDDKHVTYTVAADDMRVKSGTVTYSTTDNTGSITLTNGDGTQATINGLKDTYTKSGVLNGTTETFTRNDNTTYDVDLSGLAGSVSDKGLKFGANSGAAVTNKLGSLVNVIGEGTKEDDQYSGTNIKTKVSQTEDGTTSLEVMMDKNITGDSVTVGGKDGKDGVNGTIGVKGADGKDGVNAYATNGKDGTEGHIGLTGLAGKDGKDAKADITVTEGHVGVDGTDGHNGKDGMDRVEYKDHNDVTHEVATLDDGLKFKGDTATVIAKKLNETMDIKGGADSTKLTEGNIGVVAENGALNVKLAKDLKDLNSVTTGNTVINTNGMTVTGGPTITNTKVDVNNQKITSVKAGDVTSTSTDAVNGSQLKSYTDAAKTVVKQGANVTVTSETDKDDKHVTYTVAADDMRVKSGRTIYDITGPFRDQWMGRQALSRPEEHLYGIRYVNGTTETVYAQR
jgi:predicted RNA-binding protein YlqC (UPF0109 family)